MDLLKCSECRHRFYVPGADSNTFNCQRCGGELAVDVYGMTSIPLDARFLDPQGSTAPEVTVVELRQKSEPLGDSGRQIITGLAGYFAVRVSGRLVEVWVNRGSAADAAIRVAAVLDGVDGGWEDHFYLPTSDADPRTEETAVASGPPRGKLELVEPPDDSSSPREQEPRLGPTLNTRVRPSAVRIEQAFD